jgi:hypothetical protein
MGETTGETAGDKEIKGDGELGREENWRVGEVERRKGEFG